MLTATARAAVRQVFETPLQAMQRQYACDEVLWPSH
jgi:hypothetical protein